MHSADQTLRTQLRVRTLKEKKYTEERRRRRRRRRLLITLD
jgi:hypothetical protein